MSSLLGNSENILKSVKESIESFEELYKIETVKENQKIDILRAIILFSCSGIDAIIKELVYDTLDVIIEKSDGAQNKFKDFAAKILYKKDATVDAKLLSELFICENPKQYLIEYLKRELTANSLQNSEEIFKVASYFDIPSKNICSDFKKLKLIFDIRNQITHELDVNLASGKFEKRDRNPQDIKDFSDFLIDMMGKIIEQVRIKLEE